MTDADAATAAADDAPRRRRRVARARRATAGSSRTGEIFAALPELEPETAELAAIYARIERSGIDVVDEIIEELQREDERRAAGGDEPRRAPPGRARSPPVAPVAPPRPGVAAHRRPRPVTARRAAPRARRGRRASTRCACTSRRSARSRCSPARRRSPSPSASRPGVHADRAARGRADLLSDEPARQPRGRRRRRRAGQAAAHRGQPAPRGVDRQALRRPRAWRCSTSCRRATSA